MNRRHFLKMAAVGGAALAAGKPNRAWAQEDEYKPLHLKYAIPSWWFKDIHAIENRLELIHRTGFRAVEHNNYRQMSRLDMESYGKKLRDLGMEHGIFIANRGMKPGAGLVDPKEREVFLDEIKKSIEVAPICGAKHMTVTTGFEIPEMPRREMRANVIEGLKRGGELLAKAGIVGVVEPINDKYKGGPYFLNRSDEAYEIMKAVDNPHVKILFDIYHQQITEGNLIDNIRRFWSEIGYFQFADVPGRHEPGTGEINFRNVFKALYEMQKKTGKVMFVGAELFPSGSYKNTRGSLEAMHAIKKADEF